jgi:hypothetical protein
LIETAAPHFGRMGMMDNPGGGIAGLNQARIGGKGER